jgi:hypothetical protein
MRASQRAHGASTGRKPCALRDGLRAAPQAKQTDSAVRFGAWQWGHSMC